MSHRDALWKNNYFFHGTLPCFLCIFICHFSIFSFKDANIICGIKGNKAWWRHQRETFFALLAICAGKAPVNSPHKGQWRGALIFSLICVWINAWVNNREAGDLSCYRAHYDVTVMGKYSSYSSEYQAKYVNMFSRCCPRYWCFLGGGGGGGSHINISNTKWLAVTILRPSDVIWRHRSTFAHVMACCSRASSHYPSLLWLRISAVRWNSTQRNFLTAQVTQYS